MPQNGRNHENAIFGIRILTAYFTMYSMHFKSLKMLFFVLALPKLNVRTKKQYEIFHVPLPLSY